MAPNKKRWQMGFNLAFKGLNPICHLLALLEAHHIFHVSRIRVNLLTPNVNYSGRTAPLTFKVAFYIVIQQI